MKLGRVCPANQAHAVRCDSAAESAHTTHTSCMRLSGDNAKIMGGDHFADAQMARSAIRAGTAMRVGVDHSEPQWHRLDTDRLTQAARRVWMALRVRKFWRSFFKPSSIRVFTVPSGVCVASATSRWLMPCRKASSITCF